MTANTEHYLEQARHIHANNIVFDSMSPRITAEWVMTPEMVEIGRRMQAEGKKRYAIQTALEEYTIAQAERSPEFRRIYLDYWKRSGVTASSSTLYASGNPSAAWETTLYKFAKAARFINAFRGELIHAGWAADIETAFREKKRAVIFNMQNAEPIGDRLERVDMLQGLGVRVMQLTYNLRTHFGDGCLEQNDGGLSRLGETLIERMNTCRMMVDVSHASARTAMGAVTASKAPVIASHTSSRAVSGHVRGLSDDVMKAIADRGGYAGVVIVPAFIKRPDDDRATRFGRPATWATLDCLADHVLHLIDVMGIDHVGIGSDFGKPYYTALTWTAEMIRESSSGFDWVGWQAENGLDFNDQCAEMETWDNWHNLTATLLRRGLSESEVTKVIGGNFLRVFRDICG